MIAHEHTFDGTADRARATLYRFLVGRRASRIVCVSDGVRDAVRADGVAASKLVVVPNGVRVDGLLDRAAARTALGLPPEGVVVGMVARLRTEKQHELAFAALARLRAEGVPPTLAVVGDGPREGELRSLAEELELDARFVGERRDARTLMRAFDAVLLTSAFEGMPLAVLEALVAGVPVAATDVGTLRDLFARGGGEVAAEQTPEAVALTLRRVLGGEVPAAPPEVVHAYSIERLARDLEAVYDEVLGR